MLNRKKVLHIVAPDQNLDEKFAYDLSLVDNLRCKSVFL